MVWAFGEKAQKGSEAFSTGFGLCFRFFDVQYLYVYTRPTTLFSQTSLFFDVISSVMRMRK
jgi:hypothetical protein